MPLPLLDRHFLDELKRLGRENYFSREKCATWFRTYAGEKNELDKKDFLRFCSDLNLHQWNAVLLTILYAMDIQKADCISKAEWSKGLRILSSDNLKKLSDKIRVFNELLYQESYFKAIYSFAYFFPRVKISEYSIRTSDVIEIYPPLLEDRWALCGDFVRFLKQSPHEYITQTQWFETYKFRSQVANIFYNSAPGDKDAIKFIEDLYQEPNLQLDFLKWTWKQRQYSYLPKTPTHVSTSTKVKVANIAPSASSCTFAAVDNSNTNTANVVLPLSGAGAGATNYDIQLSTNPASNVDSINLSDTAISSAINFVDDQVNTRRANVVESLSTEEAVANNDAFEFSYNYNQPKINDPTYDKPGPSGINIHNLPVQNPLLNDIVSTSIGTDDTSDNDPSSGTASESTRTDDTSNNDLLSGTASESTSNDNTSNNDEDPLA